MTTVCFGYLASCGFRPSTIRIVGGTVAPVNSWPWQAMLTDNYGDQFCGGTLVDLYWVVTAAHCINGETPSSVKIRCLENLTYKSSCVINTELNKLVNSMTIDSISPFSLRSSQ